MFRLNVAKLREVATDAGDITGYKIHIRTGIAESSVYRYLSGESQPDLNSAMRLVEAYDLDIRKIMQRVPVEAVA